MCHSQRRRQKFDLGGHKWVKKTKQAHKKFKVDWFGGIYTDIPPVATPLVIPCVWITSAEAQRHRRLCFRSADFRRLCCAIVDDFLDRAMPERSVLWSPSDELCWAHVILPRCTQTIKILQSLTPPRSPPLYPSRPRKIFELMLSDDVTQEIKSDNILDFINHLNDQTIACCRHWKLQKRKSHTRTSIGNTNSSLQRNNNILLLILSIKHKHTCGPEVSRKQSLHRT